MDSQDQKIDALIAARQNGLKEFVRATDELIDMGVKIVSQKTGDITLSPAFSHYLDKYEKSNLEFEWEVTYNDNTKLKQFEENGEHHFGHIDQKSIRRIKFISNFEWPTDNQEKRVIVTLDWQTGLFSFLNGFISQEDLGMVGVRPIPGNDKKLILVTKKRESGTMGMLSSKYIEDLPEITSKYSYNRYVLGFEVNGIKRAVIIEPNGIIKLFKN